MHIYLTSFPERWHLNMKSRRSWGSWHQAIVAHTASSLARPRQSRTTSWGCTTLAPPRLCAASVMSGSPGKREPETTWGRTILAPRPTMLCAPMRHSVSWSAMPVPRRTRRSGRWPLLGPSRKGPSRTLHLPSHRGNPARARTARSCPSTHLEKIPSWPLRRVSPSPLWVQREALLLTTLLPLGQRFWRCIGSSCSSSRSRRLCCPP